MTNEFYTVAGNHNTFGGLIFYSDFNTDYRGNDQKKSSIAERIMSDWKFDKQCKKNAENRTKNKNYKKGIN